MPDTPCPAVSGKLNGVIGAPPLAPGSTPLPCCCPGIVIAAAPPGNDSDAGEVNAVACCALDGWVVRVSMLIIESYVMIELEGSKSECRKGTSRKVRSWGERIRIVGRGSFVKREDGRTTGQVRKFISNSYGTSLPFAKDR